jgi:hypothetical protein
MWIIPLVIATHLLALAPAAAHGLVLRGNAFTGIDAATMGHTGDSGFDADDIFVALCAVNKQNGSVRRHRTGQD